VRHLIAQIAEHRRLLLPLIFDGLSENIHQRNALSPPPFTKSQEEFVEGLILQGVIELSALGFL
jgi:hypothetical protein